MNELVSKISSYNLFTNLLPGVLYCEMSKSLFGVALTPQDLIPSLFSYYFAGMAVSRVGSLLIEPFLKWTGLLQYGDYEQYLHASQADQRLGQILETSNSYRSIVSVFVCVGATGALAILTPSPFILAALFISGGLVLFLAAYVKQNNYVNKRVRAANGGAGDDS